MKILSTWTMVIKDTFCSFVEANGLNISAMFQLYNYFRLSENKTINVFPTDYIVQLSKLTSQWANKYLTLRFNK